MKNRVVKFRVWDKETRQFLRYVCDYEYFGVCSKKGGFVGRIYSASKVILGWWNNLIVEQFTGLTDKNGKEIYEGDIVVQDFEEGAGKSVPKEVMCFNAGFVAQAKNAQWGPESNWDYIGSYVPFSWEVVGNIHENPELLK